MCSEQSHGIAGRHLENVAIQKVLADYVLVPARNRTQYEIPPTRKLLGLGEDCAEVRGRLRIARLSGQILQASQQPSGAANRKKASAAELAHRKRAGEAARRVYYSEVRVEDKLLEHIVKEKAEYAGSRPWLRKPVGGRVYCELCPCKSWSRLHAGRYVCSR